MADTIEKVYNVKAVGGDTTYTTFDKLNALFVTMAKNKQTLNSTPLTMNVDDSKLASANTKLDTLATLSEEMIGQLKIMVVGFGALGDKITATGSIGQRMMTGMKQAVDGNQIGLTKNILGFTELSNTMRSGALTAEQYIAITTALKIRISDLTAATKDNMETSQQYGRWLKNNVVGQEEYDISMKQITASQVEFKAALVQTEKELELTTTLWNLSSEAAAQNSAQIAANKLQIQQMNAMLKLEAQANQALAGSVEAARIEITQLNREQERLVVIRKEGVAITDEELAANIARRDAIIAEKNALHEFVAANADANLARILNIGKYPTLTSELSALKVQMQELVLAGKKDSEEFATLSARANELSASMREVSANTGKAIFSLENLGRRVESGLFRMFVHLAVFALIMEGIQLIGEAWNKTSENEKKAQEATDELNKSLLQVQQTSEQFFDKEKANTENLLTIVKDLNVSYTGRIEAMQQLIALYPELLAGMSSEGILNGQSIEQMDKLNKVMAIKTNIQDLTQKISLKSKNIPDLKQDYDKASDEWSGGEGFVFPDASYAQSKKDEFVAARSALQEAEAVTAALREQLKQANLEMYKLMHPKADFETLAGLKAKLNSLTQDIQTMHLAKGVTDKTTPNEFDALISADPNYGAKLKQKMADIKQLEDLIKKIEGKEKKGTQGKEPHDYTAAMLEAQKKLTDFVAKELEERIHLEMNAQSVIFNNVENSLQDRLKAFAIYAKDEKQILSIESASQIKDVQDKLDKIAEIEKAVADKKAGYSYNKVFFGKDGNLRPEEQTLLINKDALNEQLTYIGSEFKTKLEQTATSINNEIASITKSGIGKMLQDIDVELTNKLTDIEAKTNTLKEGVYGSNKTDGEKDQKIVNISQSTTISGDKAALEADKQKEEVVSEQLEELKFQQSHNEAIIALEHSLQDQLTQIKKKGEDDRAKLDADTNKQEVSGKEQENKINEALENAAVEVATSFANDYMQLMQKQDAYRQAMMQRSMDWNEKVLNSEAQSNQQKLAQDKAFNLTQQQMSKEKMEQDKKRAEAQALLDYASAAITLMVKTIAAPTWNPITGMALLEIEEGILAATFSAKEALLASAPTFGGGGDVPASGGIFGGNSHSSGGTPFSFMGRNFEAEADELAIINKRSANSNQQMTVSGTPKQIASQINAHGGGVNFAPGGKMFKFEYGGSLGGQIQPPSFVSAYYTQGAIDKANNSQLYNMVVENTKALQMHSQVLTEHANALQYESDKKVYIPLSELSHAQDSHKKAKAIGTFGK